MRIFVTGATGFVGSAVVQELLHAGHEVIGLCRSDAGEQSLIAAGARVHRGELHDPESLRKGAAMSDGVIHTAFIHDFSKWKENCEIDQHAIEALGSALAGSGRPLIVTSGTGLLHAGPDGIVTEDIPAPPPTDAVPRVSEQAGAAVAKLGVNVSVVRLPPSVHGAGDHGFVPILINLARQKGSAAYIGDGMNHWPAVHRLDAARLYRLIIEKNASGDTYHGIADEGVPFREIETVIGRRLNLPVVSKTGEEAQDYFGWFTYFASLNNTASSARTRELLGWQPTQHGLIADIDSSNYFPA